MRRGRWPQELRHPLFVVGTALYVVLFALKHGGPVFAPWRPPALVRAHLADVLALPLELTLLLYLMRHWYFRNPAFVLPTGWIVSTGLVFAVWFEGLLPLFDHRATADWRDVLAYAVGGFVFWRWMNRPATR